jgi:hypothetical protein
VTFVRLLSERVITRIMGGDDAVCDSQDSIQLRTDRYTTPYHDRDTS